MSSLKNIKIKNRKNNKQGGWGLQRQRKSLFHCSWSCFYASSTSYTDKSISQGWDATAARGQLHMWKAVFKTETENFSWCSNGKSWKIQHFQQGNWPDAQWWNDFLREIVFCVMTGQGGDTTSWSIPMSWLDEHDGILALEHLKKKRTLLQTRSRKKKTNFMASFYFFLKKKRARRTATCFRTYML